MECLYVCLFSNGHIKVGRSVDPKARIASHADRVACLGIELVDHCIVESVDLGAQRERELIDRCAQAADQRHKSEWFSGLNFHDVCGWARECAAMKVESKWSSVKSIRDALGVTQKALAEGIGCSQGNVSNYENGQSVPNPAAERLITYARSLGLPIDHRHVYGGAAMPARRKTVASARA